MNQTEVTTIVYPWIARMARGNELLYSLRSVEKNFQPPVDLWVVGDCPDWFAGNWLSCQVYDEKICLPRQDRAKKLWTVIQNSQVGDTFLWMMDDIYFVRPIRLSDLRRPYICGKITPENLLRWKPEREWTRQKRLTWLALYENGKSLYDFSTHLPHVYEKDKWRVLFKKYGLPDSPYIDDSLYENEFYPFDEPPLESRKILYRESRRPSQEILREHLIASGIQVFNHVDRSYSPAVESLLQELFPRPSRWERPAQ